MPTQIIDGFRLNAATPIDTRIVAANAAQRNNITYKYEGLRVFDLTDKTGYVWLDGQWKEEGTTSITNNNIIGGGGGGSINGKLNSISKFDTKGLTNSIITESFKNSQYFIGVGVQQTTYRLEVNGSFKATSITGQIDGSNVTVDTLALDRLKKPTAAGNFVLKYNGVETVWVTESTSAASIGITNTTIPDSTHYVLFSDSSQSTSATIRANYHTATKLLGFKPDTAQVLGASQEVPAYSIVGQTSTGLYGTDTELGLKMQDMKILKTISTETQLGFYTGGVTPTLTNSLTLNASQVSVAQKLVVQNYITLNYNTSDDTSTITINTKPKTTQGFATSGPNVRRSGFIRLEYANGFGNGVVLNKTSTYLKLGVADSAGTRTDFITMFVDDLGVNKISIRPNLNGSSVLAGSILKSVDTNGTLTWGTVDTGVPYGTVMIWPFQDDPYAASMAIPSGWKEVNGVGFIYLNGQYRTMPDYRDRMLFGRPDGFTGIGTQYGTLSPTVASVDVTLATANIPAHQHVFSVPKHRHYMQGSATDGEAANTAIATSGAHSHRIQTRDQGNGEGYVGESGSSSQAKWVTGEMESSSHSHAKTDFTGYTSYRIYDNAGNEGLGSLGTTYPTSYYAITERLNYNVDGGGIQPISIAQRKVVSTRYIMKYNPSATQNQEGHWSLSSSGASPTPSPSTPTPSPWTGPSGGLAPGYPSWSGGGYAPFP